MGAQHSYWTIGQDGKKIPKWDRRVRVECYVGRLPLHAGSVALILNTHTVHVSPQFHVVFDDEFTAGEALQSNTQPSNWENLYDNQRELVTDTEYTIASNWCDDEGALGTEHENRELAWQRPSSVLDSTSAQANEGEACAHTPVHEGATSANEGVVMPNEGAPAAPPSFAPIDLNTTGLRRSSRLKKGPAPRLNLITTMGMLGAMAMSAINNPAQSMHKHLPAKYTSLVTMVIAPNIPIVVIRFRRGAGPFLRRDNLLSPAVFRSMGAKLGGAAGAPLFVITTPSFAKVASS